MYFQKIYLEKLILYSIIIISLIDCEAFIPQNREVMLMTEIVFLKNQKAVLS